MVRKERIGVKVLRESERKKMKLDGQFERE